MAEELINQDWELWEKEKIFPGKKGFKKFGDGVSQPSVTIKTRKPEFSSGVVIALAVQTDMSTPAMAVTEAGLPHTDDEFDRISGKKECFKMWGGNIALNFVNFHLFIRKVLLTPKI